MHETPYLSGKPRPSLLQSFSNNKLLPQKHQDHQKEGTLLDGRQIQERSTIILYFRQTLHAYYLLEDYQLDHHWYMYIFLLKVFALLSLQISYILGPFGMTLLHTHFIHLSNTI